MSNGEFTGRIDPPVTITSGSIKLSFHIGNGAFKQVSPGQFKHQTAGYFIKHCTLWENHKEKYSEDCDPGLTFVFHYGTGNLIIVSNSTEGIEIQWTSDTFTGSGSGPFNCTDSLTGIVDVVGPAKWSGALKFNPANYQFDLTPGKK
jgi:hypothetical protein